MPRLTELAVKAAKLQPDVQLQPHQERVRDRLSAEDRRLLLYHGLGTGKSLSSLAAAENAGGDYAAVVPAALKPNYEKEITKFTDSTPEVLTYTGVGAGKQPKRSPETLIFDEAHRLRNPNAASARAATELAQKAKNVLLLTGTPITNAPSDLASLASILNQKSITPEAFNERYVGHKKVYPSWLSRLTGRNVGEEGVLKNEEELRQLFRGKVDYQPGKSPEGVDVNEETVRVPLGRSQERLQTAVRDKIPPEYAWKFDKQFPLSRDELQGMNSFLTGLRQSSLSTLPFRGDKDPLKSFDESSKLQRAFQDLKTELKTDPRKKGLVYSNYIDAGLSPYAAALKREGIPYGMYHGSMSAEERKQALKGYNEGNLRALLLGPAAAEGISTQGTNLIQVLDPHWHESRSRQAEGRGLRFDSHAGLPEELRHVAIKRYLSESRDPSLIMSLLGKRRHRTGDEILERLSADKEKLNNQFRKILQEEGSVSKSAGVLQGGLTMNEIEFLARQAAYVKSASGVTELAQAALRTANKLPGSLDDLAGLAAKGVKSVGRVGDDIAEKLTKVKPRSSEKRRIANMTHAFGRAPTEDEIVQHIGIPSNFDDGVYGKFKSELAPPEPMEPFKKYMQSFAKKPDAVRPRGILERLRPYLPYLGGVAVGNGVGAGAMYTAAQRAKSDRN